MPNAPPGWGLVAGREEVLRCLRRGEPLQRIEMVDPLERTRGELADLARRANVTLRVVPAAALAAACRGLPEGGVAGWRSAVTYTKLEALLGLSPEDRPCVVAFDGVENPRNLGLAARSLVAAGLPWIIVPEGGSAAADTTLLEASAGLAPLANWIRVPRLPGALDRLRRAGWWIFGLEEREGARTLWSHALPRPCVLVLGNETLGLRPAVSAQLQESLRIPLAPGVDSLNVAVAASVAAFELARRSA